MSHGSLIEGVSELLSSVDRKLAILDVLQHRLERIEQKIDNVERFPHGAPAVRVAGDRVLTRTLVDGHMLIYFVEADDLLLAPHFIMHGSYESALSKYFARTLLPTDHCADIGANFGYFTCLMAKFAYAGRVLGVEADKKVFELARDNIYANWAEGIASVVNVAVSDGPGEITLYRRIGRSGNTGMIQIAPEQQAATGEASPEPFQVATMAIDDVLSRLNGRVNYMKIDVEGAEPLALRGARGTIAANPYLKIVMEWSPDQMQSAGFSVSDFTTELNSMGLNPSILDENGGVHPTSYPELLQKGFLTGILLTRAA